MRMALEAVENFGRVFIRRTSQLEAVLNVAMAEATFRLQMAARMIELRVDVLDRQLAPARERDRRLTDRVGHLQILILRIDVTSAARASAPLKRQLRVAAWARRRLDLMA